MDILLNVFAKPRDRSYTGAGAVCVIQFQYINHLPVLGLNGIDDTKLAWSPLKKLTTPLHSLGYYYITRICYNSIFNVKNILPDSCALCTTVCPSFHDEFG